MKKMISMMLMLCAIFTFSACSSDDDDPVNPLTGVVIPQSAQIGSVMTIQGTGFAAGQVIQLTLADAEPVEVEAKYSANGATFTVPYTLSTGTASVVLKVGNNNWPLGSVMLTAPANPISAFSLPSESFLPQLCCQNHLVLHHRLPIYGCCLCLFQSEFLAEIRIRLFLFLTPHR